MIGTVRFYKTPSDRWYIDLPDWSGSIEELGKVSIFAMAYCN
ncbi:MAG: DUF6717 family protein [Pedobacter sp.]